MENKPKLLYNCWMLQISYKEFQALLDRLAKIEKRLEKAENDRREEFALTGDVLEGHGERLVAIEDKLFPGLRKTLGQLNRMLRPSDSKRFNSLDYPIDKPVLKKK